MISVGLGGQVSALRGKKFNIVIFLDLCKSDECQTLHDGTTQALSMHAIFSCLGFISRSQQHGRSFRRCVMHLSLIHI